MFEGKERVTVKDLADAFDVKPIKVRKVLRKLGIQTDTVEVPDGWPGQKRRQYLWSPADPEVEKIVKELKA